MAVIVLVVMMRVVMLVPMLVWPWQGSRSWLRVRLPGVGSNLCYLLYPVRSGFENFSAARQWLHVLLCHCLYMLWLVCA